MVGLKKNTKLAFALVASVSMQACGTIDKIDNKIGGTIGSMAPALPTMSERVDNYSNTVKACEARNDIINSVPFNTSLVAGAGFSGILLATKVCFGFPVCAVVVTSAFSYRMSSYLEDAIVRNCGKEMKPNYIEGETSTNNVTFTKVPTIKP